MKYISPRSGLLFSSVLVSFAAVGILATAPVYARQGADDSSEVHSSDDDSTKTATPSPTPKPSGSNSGSGSSSGSGGRGSSENKKVELKTEHGIEIETHNSANDSTKIRVSSLEDKAKQLLEAKRAEDKSNRSVADRQKACTARKAQLDRKFTKFTTEAKNALARYTTTFDKVQDYQSTNQLADDDYLQLVATATADKTAATGAVDALATVSTEIDCTADDPAITVTTVKTAVATAKSALKDYRSSIKAVIVSLLAVKNGETN